MSSKVGFDLFSGSGGLSIGAQNAGISTAIAVEKDKSAAETFKFNHNDAIVLTQDIQSIDLSSFNIKPFIIFGGPPCQGFSLSNSKTRNEENTNNLLYTEFIRIVQEFLPEWFLFENVEGILSFNKGQTVLTIKESFEKLGYNVTYDVLCASDYGVPQHRNRFFMVGNKSGIKFEFPQKYDTQITVKQAISDLPELINGQHAPELPYKSGAPSTYAAKMRKSLTKALQNYVSSNSELVLQRYKHIKPGQNWKAIPLNLMSNYTETKNCHSGIYKRLNPDQPSVVISNYRKNMLIHPEQDRGLSVREAARLQSFPDDFIFKGNITSIQQQIGNAVPPLLAEAIFQKILSY